MTDKITVKAPAKINLTLHITGKRPDGYHTLKSVMQSISLCDIVTVGLNGNAGTINISCTDPSIPCDSRNIAFRSAEAFYNAAGIENAGIDIHIEKNIPSEAGLGGGSADGAAVFYALNQLYGAPFTEDKLCSISSAIGADIPFCIKGGTVLCEGIGEIMTPLKPLPDCFIVIGKGNEGISTKEAYAAIDSNPEATYCDFDTAIFKGSIEKIASHCSNAFEKVSPLDEIRRIKGLMLGSGALCSVMSGSGSAVYGIFRDKPTAEEACAILAEDGYFSALCTPETKGALILK